MRTGGEIVVVILDSFESSLTRHHVESRDHADINQEHRQSG